MPAFVFISRAQISKASVYLGGGLGYAKTPEERTVISPSVPNAGEVKTLTISPATGIAVKRNLIVGVTVSYGKGAQNNYNNTGSYENKVFWRRCIAATVVSAGKKVLCLR